MCSRLFIRSAIAFTLISGAIAPLGVLKAQAQVPQAPYLSLDVKTGKVIQHRNAFKRWSPASLTKLMTSYVTFRALKAGELTLQSPVRQSKNSISEPPSKMGYPVGTILSIDNAINVVLVKSANDISVALAEAVGGSEAAFIARMNAEARRLGMSGTNFANPHGLHESNQYTTARDMGLLALAIKREFPEHAYRFNLQAIKAGKRTLRSYNLLIGRFAGADGMKTGYVCASGFNLVSSASRNRRSVIAVVLGATSQNQRAEVSADLLANAFKTRNGTKIERLAAYGADRNQAANMRPHICSSAAQRSRTELRDKKGRLIINSPHVKAREGTLQVHPIKLGDAGGPISLAARNTTVGLSIAAKRKGQSGTVIAMVPRFRPDGVNFASANAPTTAASLPQAKIASTTNNTGSLLNPGTTPIAGQATSTTLNKLAPIPRFRPN